MVLLLVALLLIAAVAVWAVALASRRSTHRPGVLTDPRPYERRSVWLWWPDVPERRRRQTQPRMQHVLMT